MSEERAQEYRESVVAHLGAERVEAAGFFERKQALNEPDLDTLTVHAFALVFDSINRLYDWLRKGSVGRLPRRFLLAVTSERVHVFKVAGPSVDEVAVFDRHRVWLRRAPPGRVWLCTRKDSRVHEIVLDGSLLEENPGAAEVLAALPEHHANEAAGLRE